MQIKATTPTKPVKANRENAYFFLSSWQQLKSPPNECPISPLPLFKVQDSMAIIHVGFQTKTTLNRGWGGGLLFLFRGDRSRAQKLKNRWNCLNSFVQVFRNFHVTLKFWKTSLQVISTSNNIILYYMHGCLKSNLSLLVDHKWATLRENVQVCTNSFFFLFQTTKKTEIE